jgi:hypothetical protein
MPFRTTDPAHYAIVSEAAPQYHRKMINETEEGRRSAMQHFPFNDYEKEWKESKCCTAISFYPRLPVSRNTLEEST